MRALVVYESMFGNTEEVAHAVADGLAQTMQVEARRVWDAPAPVTTFVDLIVVGGPTHAFSMSRPASRAEAIEKGATRGDRDVGLREWIDGVKKGPHSELVAAFDTRSERARHLPGSAARKAMKLLRHDGYAPAGVESFYVSDTAGPLLPGELERALAWGRRLGEDMESRAHGRPVRA